MIWPEQDGVRAPHSRVQPERHRETGCRADRVPLLELPYLFDLPAVKPLLGACERLHARCRVAPHPTTARLHGPVKHDAQIGDAMVCGGRGLLLRKMYRRVTISVLTPYTLAWRSAGWRRPDAEALRERIWRSSIGGRL